MPGDVKISVITPCFNSAKTIGATIESVRAQDYTNYEHIVIDGGSTDGTLEILHQYPDLVWVSEKDEGHYHAMNKGIQRARGDVVVILNADDCYREGAFRKVARAFREHRDWDGLFADVVFVDGQGAEIYRRQEARFDYTVLRFTFNYVCHHTLFVKKRLYDALGPYRYKEFKNCCDYDFVLRLARAGRTIGHLPEYLVNFRYHEFGQSLDKRIVRNFDVESARLKREHGCPAGIPGKVLYVYGHCRRQWQKLFLRGTCDVVPARWILRKYFREKTSFSSNIGLDKL